MIDLKVYRDFFLSSFIYADTNLEELNEMTNIANKLELDMFGRDGEYLLMRLLKHLIKDYTVLPSSNLVLSYIENIQNLNLRDVLLSTFFKVSEVTPMTANVLNKYVEDFEKYYLLSERKGLR